MGATDHPDEDVRDVSAEIVESLRRQSEFYEANPRVDARPDEDPWTEFMSDMGCRVQVLRAPEGIGSGLLLRYTMPPPDRRFAELYLSEDDVETLQNALETEMTR
jgi:hypothetical protein